jgi:hypothetical protein
MQLNMQFHALDFALSTVLTVFLSPTDRALT